jgi:hypothetical protein
MNGNEKAAPRAIGKPKKGPPKRPVKMPEWDLFLFVPDDDDTTGDLKPISDLPQTVQFRVQQAVEELLKPRLKRVQTIFGENNSNTYIDRKICVGRFIYQRTRNAKCPSTIACPSCEKIDGRPCVRLETHPTEERTILVSYARQAGSRGEATWKDWQFWLGSRA